MREHYSDYGPTLASEMLAWDLTVNRETLRQWMSRAGLWKPRRAKLKRLMLVVVQRPVDLKQVRLVGVDLHRTPPPLEIPPQQPQALRRF